MELKDFSSPQPVGAVAVIFKPGVALPDGKAVSETAVLVAQKTGDNWAWLPISRAERQIIENLYKSTNKELHTWYWYTK